MKNLIITCSTKELFIEVSKKLVKEGYNCFDKDCFLKGQNWSEKNNTINASGDNWDSGFCYLEFYQTKREYGDYKFLTARQYLGITKSMTQKLNLMMKRLLDADTKKLIKGGLINGDLELTEEGIKTLQAIVFEANKVELVKIAEENIKEAKEEKDC